MDTIFKKVKSPFGDHPLPPLRDEDLMDRNILRYREYILDKQMYTNPQTLEYIVDGYIRSKFGSIR